MLENNPKVQEILEGLSKWHFSFYRDHGKWADYEIQQMKWLLQELRSSNSQLRIDGGKLMSTQFGDDFSLRWYESRRMYWVNDTSKRGKRYWE